MTLASNDTVQYTTLTRTDEKKLRIATLESSKAWITATVEPGTNTDETAARIRVTVQRSGMPRRFNEYVYIYAGEHTNAPVSSLYLYGEVMGEVSLSSEALYWSVPDAAKLPPAGEEAMVIRRVMIRSASGQTLELKNPQSTLKSNSCPRRRERPTNSSHDLMTCRRAPSVAMCPLKRRWRRNPGLNCRSSSTCSNSEFLAVKKGKADVPISTGWLVMFSLKLLLLKPPLVGRGGVFQPTQAQCRFPDCFPSRL